ncbi:MAG: hypothetical protein ISR76_00925 [Planctomycetes bacterium]|nr:hypothetical protein [Planctomycetota bacterium]
MQRFRRSAAGALVLAGAALLALPGCGPDASPFEAHRAPMKVEPEYLRLPRIPFGKGAAGEFRLTNEGRDPLRITGIGPTGCDCAVADLLLPDRPEGMQHLRVQERGMRLELAPGEQAVLKLTLSTLRYREPVRFKASSIPIQFEGYDHLALEYSADIWVPFWAEPWALQLGTLGVRQRPTGRIAVRAVEEAEFQILAPADLDGWELEIRQASADPDSYNIEVTPPPELPVGSFMKDFELRTSIPEMPVRFTVVGTVVPDVAHSPQRLLLRPDEGVRSGAVTVTLLPTDRPLRLLGAEVRSSTGAACAVEIEPTIPGRSYRVSVTLPEDPATLGQDATLLIRTDDDETPLIEVRVQVLRTAPR